MPRRSNNAHQCPVILYSNSDGSTRDASRHWLQIWAGSRHSSECRDIISLALTDGGRLTSLHAPLQMNSTRIHSQGGVKPGCAFPQPPPRAQDRHFENSVSRGAANRSKFEIDQVIVGLKIQQRP